MPGPWEQYQSQSPDSGEKKPWEQYAAQGDMLVKPGSGSPSRPNAELPSDLPAKVGRAALKTLPAIGAVAATMAGPEAWPAAIGMAALGGAGGEAVKQGIESATGMPERPRSITEAMRNVASSGVEQAAYEAGGRALGAGARFIGNKLNPSQLYGRALKPSTKMRVPDRDKLIQTGLDERIPVSREGYEKTTGLTDSLNDEINQKVQSASAAQGPVIDPVSVANRTMDAQRKFSKQVNPTADVAAVQNSRNEFLAKHSSPGTNNAPPTVNPMTIAEAQAEKQGTYQQLRKKYGELGSADTEAQKALARGLKEEIVSRVPELQQLNERDSALIGLEQALAKYVGREENKNSVGLIPSILLGTMTGGAIHGAEGAAAGGAVSGIARLAALAIDNPEIKSKLAIAMTRVAKSAAGKGIAKAASKVAPAIKVGARSEPWTWGDAPPSPRSLEQ